MEIGDLSPYCLIICVKWNIWFTEKLFTDYSCDRSLSHRHTHPSVSPPKKKKKLSVFLPILPDLLSQTGLQ